MRGYRAIDVVQMLLVFGIHGYGCAQIVAFGAGADFDVLFGGVGRVLLDGFEDFAAKSGCAAPMILRSKWVGKAIRGFCSVMVKIFLKGLRWVLWFSTLRVALRYTP